MSQQGHGIVIGYDGSPGADVALEWAADMAKRRDEALTLVYSTGGGAPRSVLDEGLARASELLDDGAVHGVVADDGPAAALVKASATASMVVTGNRERSRVESGLLGSVSYAVTAHAQCPAVVVRGGHLALPDKDHKVVVGVDGSDSSHAALAAAAEVAASTGAPLLVASVGPMHAPESWAYAETSSAGTDHTHAMRAEAEQSVTDAQARLGALASQVSVETDVLYGHAGHVIAELGRDAGLVVVGSRGRAGFAGLLLGSVSHTVIHEAQCPVMVVRGR